MLVADGGTAGTRAGGGFAVGYRGRASAKTGVFAATLLAGVAYCGFMILDGGAAPAVRAFAIAGFALAAPFAVLLVSMSLRAAARTLRGAPLLTLDGAGVTLHSARVTLPWSNVAEIRVDHTPGRDAGFDLIVFVPADERAAVAGLRGMPGRFARDGMHRVGGPIFIRAGQLARPLEEVLTAARGLTTAPVRRRQVLTPAFRGPAR